MQAVRDLVEFADGDRRDRRAVAGDHTEIGQLGIGETPVLHQVRENCAISLICGTECQSSA
ncbi:hypothetical protein [Streptomyces sp. NPDC059906]|uniref:hypothetical protein n=1 Tax=Streptomyces sp. NPDC059906 TaxID=3346997 RepID=UPI00364E7DDA